MKRILFLFCFVFMMSGALAFSNPSSNWQANQPTFDNLYAGDFSNYWPILDGMKDGNCNANGTDFIIGIPPGGCSPMVVRSDLLAEQNVPVFCQLYAIKVNPLIDVSSIKSISFKGDYPEGVRSVVYHPARAAVKSYSTLIGSPALENIGYVVIILKQNKVEANMSEWIAGNLTATMKYDSEEVYGVGRGDYYLEPTSESEWERNYVASQFWNGRGYLRVLDVSDGSAKIQVMGSKDKVLRTLTLKKGETSSSSYLPGFYCKAGLKVKLSDITTQEDMARLNIDGNDVWVRKGGKFLGGKCSVKSLNVRGNNDGEIGISCSGAGNIEPLVLTSAGARFNVDGKDITVKLGEKIEEGWHLAYVGNYPKGFDEKMGEIAILVKDKSFDDALVFSIAVSKLMDESGDVDGFKKALEKVGIWKNEKDKKEFVVVEEGYGVEFSEFLGAGNVLKDEGTADKHFKKSVEIVEKELVAEYGSEEKDIGGTWAEEALFEEIVLAGKLGQFVERKRLMDLFLDEYPLSSYEPYVREMRSKASGTDYSKSYVSVFVGDEFKSISLVDFKAIGEGERRVDLRIGNNPYPGRNESDNISLGNSGDLEIKDISPGKVRVYFKSKVDKAKGDARSRSVTIKEGESEVFNGVSVYVNEIHVNEVAHVTLIPEIKNDKSEADFTFRIGIEQRAIELSPDKALDLLENLNASIEKWQNIVDRLGTVVTGLKGACFATSAVLMIKNMASGSSGEAAARTKVMEKYKKKCDTEFSEMSRTECYNHFSSEIDADVSAMSAVLNGVNKRMEVAQNGNTDNSGGLFGGTSIKNSTKYLDDLKGQIKTEKIDVDVGGEVIEISRNDLYSVSQIRSVLTWEDAEARGLGDIAKVEMDKNLRNVALSVEGKKEQFDLEKQFVFDEVRLPVSVLNKGQSAFSNGGVTVRKTDVDSIVNKELGLAGVEDYDEIGVQIVHAGSKDYLYLFDAKGAQLGIYEVEKEGDNLNIIGEKDSLPKVEGANVRMVTTGTCVNPWPKGRAKVSYYEAGSNKGLPAIVPFDLKEGWYAMVPNSGGTFVDDSPQGYTASGDVKYFKICNIGDNGLMQNCAGDDLVQSFDANTAGSVKSYGKCSVDAGKLYEKAREAIRKASQQYGERQVNIFDQMMETGEPMSQVGGFECQDFMSPSDCKLMFNVCDPVICPPSRCDFGGKFPVSDVIQTGIIGSLALCLPNAREGIFVPICLSGVQAGLDGYLSILKSEKACLETSIESGELVGICDQITAIYKCEFFWRQMSPLMDQIVPGILDFVSGGSSVRGGGEYALATQAWATTKKSMSYFKDTYAQNAFKAFNIRSTQEVGSSFCKAFIGTSVPGSANFLENLLAPESPSQFYAQFSEQTFTEATVPSTSHYKVYYHIYAGNDQGVQYKIYLKNPPASSYYASNPEVPVKSGFIAAGSSADESVDFTAPSGYKELCVVVNAQEKCGFKQVTTDFGLDFLSKKYTEEQATSEDIKSEKECVSGTPSALSMANLNLQAGLEESMSPEIALRGIVRVCATQNPGAGVSATNEVGCTVGSEQSAVSSLGCGTGFECVDGGCVDKAGSGTVERSGGKWKDVGYCGEASLRCWLDVDSVKDDLKAVSDLEGKSISVLDERKGLIENTRLNLEGVLAILSKARVDIKELGMVERSLRLKGGLNISRELDKVIGTRDAAGAGTNENRAEALSLKASVYRLLAGKVLEEETEKVEGARDLNVDSESDVGKGDDGLKTSGSDECMNKEGEVYDMKLKEGKPFFIKYEGGWMYSLGRDTEYKPISFNIDRFLDNDLRVGDLADKDFYVGCGLIEGLAESSEMGLRALGEGDRVVFDYEKISDGSYKLSLDGNVLPFSYNIGKDGDGETFDKVVSEFGKFVLYSKFGVVNLAREGNDELGLGGYEFSSFNGACFVRKGNVEGIVTFGKGDFCDEVLKARLTAAKYSEYEECKGNIEDNKQRYEFKDKFCTWKELRSTYREICSELTDEDITSIFENKKEYRDRLSSGKNWLDLESREDSCFPVFYDCVSSLFDKSNSLGYSFAAGSPIFINPYQYNGKLHNAKDFYFTLMHEGYHGLQYGVREVLSSSGGPYLASNIEIDPRVSIVQLWWLEKTCDEKDDKSVILAKGIIDNETEAENVLDIFYNYNYNNFDEDFSNYSVYAGAKRVFNSYSSLSFQEWEDFKNIIMERLPGIAYGEGEVVDYSRYA